MPNVGDAGVIEGFEDAPHAVVHLCSADRKGREGAEVGKEESWAADRLVSCSSRQICANAHRHTQAHADTHRRTQTHIDVYRHSDHTDMHTHVHAHTCTCTNERDAAAPTFNVVAKLPASTDVFEGGTREERGVHVHIRLTRLGVGGERRGSGV